jgi:hypothetical protein
MPINLRKIDEAIQRLQDIKRIMSDPKSAALVEELLGNASSRRSEMAQRVDDLRFDLTAQPAAVTKRAPSQARAIRELISQINGAFDVDMIGKMMRSSAHNIDNIAVGKVLQRLFKQGKIRLVERGVGSAPNRYMADGAQPRGEGSIGSQ